MPYRVLIVDDDEDARILLLRALSKGGLDVEVASAADGREALEMLVTLRPHVVITDIMMPRVDGFELCAALRGNPATADIPIIIVSALEGATDRARGLAAGANQYLTKPFNGPELTACLAELLPFRVPA